MRSLCFILMFSPFFGSTACKKHNNSPATSSETDVPGPAIQLNSFPLKPGNMWVYDSGDTIRVVADTVINGVAATKLTKNNAHYSLAVYCTNLPDGLHMLAANSSNAFETLTVPVLDDPAPLVVPDPSVQFTKLPVSLDGSWEAHIPNMKYSTRQWVKYVTVTTPAGTFNCVKMSAGYFDEYYSDKGIIKRVDHPECFAAPCPDMITKLVYVNF